MGLGKDYEGQDCGLARAMEVAGERWMLLVIRDAFYGVRRYNDFLVHLDIPRAVLAVRLQTLVRAGIMERRRYQETPPRDEYVLTEQGRGLWTAVHALMQWGEEHFSPAGPRRLFLHVDCAARIDAEGICPKCGRRVSPEEIETRRVSPARRDDAVTRALDRPHRLLQPLFGEPLQVTSGGDGPSPSLD